MSLAVLACLDLKDKVLDASNQLFWNRLGVVVLADPIGRPDNLISVRLEQALGDRNVMRAARGGRLGILL